MSEADTPPAPPVTVASVGLEGQVEAMRAVLIRLLQEVVQAESRLDGNQANHLMEANEQLVVNAMLNQTNAESASQALHDVMRAAELDPLTQLPNRVLLLDRFSQAIAHAKRNKTRLALLFVDINGFKQINDTLGHAAGDQVLCRVARCLVASVRAEDTVSRHGGDEFLILLSGVGEAADAGVIAHKMLAALDAPESVGDRLVRLSASIGISLYPDDADEPQQLINLADRAMYRAKRQALGGWARHGVLTDTDAEPSIGRVPTAPGQPDDRHARLQEANEHLLLAGLTAQELQVAAEQAKQRLLDFLATIAHELRDPLAPIRIATSMLGRIRTDEPLLPRAQAIIERQVDHMSRLVDDLLDAARVGKGKLTLDKHAVEMADIVADAVASCRPAMDARRQRFELVAPHAPLVVEGDSLRLAQVLNNLLNNASKYTPDGGHISLTLAPGNEQLTLELADNGIGITAAALPHIFDPFVQDAQAIAFNGFGLGIGLTVVREIVQAHGGSVVAASAGLGLGSRFVVTLPLLTKR